MRPAKIVYTRKQRDDAALSDLSSLWFRRERIESVVSDLAGLDHVHHHHLLLAVAAVLELDAMPACGNTT